MTLPVGNLKAIRLRYTDVDSREWKIIEFEHLGGIIETPKLSGTDQLISMLKRLHPRIEVERSW